MPYKKWFTKTLKQVQPLSEFELYVRVSLFSLLIFGGSYAYTSWLKTPNVLNKSVADTSTLLIALSMMLSALCYFWNFVDSKIIYRKHLGLVGFAFGVVHLLLSWAAFQRLFQAETWQNQTYLAPFSGLLALIIFAIMALVSNRYSAMQLGGRVWRSILRTGYLGMFFVLVHVVALKMGRWLAWYQEGMKTPPAFSLIISVVIIVTIILRVCLWWAIRQKQVTGK